MNAENDNPEGFALLSPDSGSVVQGFDQYLIWLPSTDLDGDTVEYEVFIDNQSIGVTNHNYMEVRDLVDDVTYEWYVIASDGIGGVATSATWFFTVNAENNPPSEFSLLYLQMKLYLRLQALLLIGKEALMWIFMIQSHIVFIFNLKIQIWL